MHTTLGFTGQREDTQAPGSSGLYYFNARYYDPTIGRFTSADPTRPDLGSPWGTDAYGYVGGMVETATDPSGLECDACIDLGGAGPVTTSQGPSSPGGGGSASGGGGSWVGNLVGDLLTLLIAYGMTHQQPSYTPAAPASAQSPFLGGVVQAVGQAAAYVAQQVDAQQAMYDAPLNRRTARTRPAQVSGPPPPPPPHPTQSSGGPTVACPHGCFESNTGQMDYTDPCTVEFVPSSALCVQWYAGGDTGASGASENCSFASDTPVATPTGEKTIGTLKVGDSVEAYNPTSGKVEPELVQHVWLNHDHDLVDVRITSAQMKDAATTRVVPTHGISGHGFLADDATSSAIHLSPSRTFNASGETIHTTANHPWLTADRGWIQAGQLRPGEPLVTLNGSNTGTVAWVHTVSGQGDMYNLMVAHDHTVAVGDGRWIVHNHCVPTLTNWGRPHSTHFGVRWVQRGKPSPAEMDTILTGPNSIPLTTGNSGNHGLAGKTSRGWYTIWYDPTDGNKLVDIQNVAHGGVNGTFDPHIGQKWYAQPLGWVNPFIPSP